MINEILANWAVVVAFFALVFWIATVFWASYHIYRNKDELRKRNDDFFNSHS